MADEEFDENDVGDDFDDDVDDDNIDELEHPEEEGDNIDILAPGQAGNILIIVSSFQHSNTHTIFRWWCSKK